MRDEDRVMLDAALETLEHLANIVNRTTHNVLRAVERLIALENDHDELAAGLDNLEEDLAFRHKVALDVLAGDREDMGESP